MAQPPAASQGLLHSGGSQGARSAQRSVSFNPVEIVQVRTRLSVSRARSMQIDYHGPEIDYPRPSHDR
jgi:hypothetical protein